MARQFGVRFVEDRAPFEQFSTYSDAEAFVEANAGHTVMQVVSRPAPSEWRFHPKPVDHSATPEEVADMDHLVARIDNAYMLHAFELTEKHKENLLEVGFGTYVGVYRGGGSLDAVCSKIKKWTYNRQGVAIRGDITTMENVESPGFDGTTRNSVCTQCQQVILKRRKEASA